MSCEEERLKQLFPIRHTFEVTALLDEVMENVYISERL